MRSAEGLVSLQAGREKFANSNRSWQRAMKILPGGFEC